MIPVSIWFLAKDKKDNKFRDRRGEILFIDARKMGIMIDRRHRELTDEEIARIAATYHAWRGEGGKYKDVLGFCKAAKFEEIRKNEHILTPGRYVGMPTKEEDTEKFEEKMKRLANELGEQFAKSSELEEEIKKNLKSIGYQIK
jgi:type I restriction enzyme M protein